ncbi:MAG TPA: GNAT family N-acetyltransferase [Acidimicrobiia bacterium]|nr:GNAT family N-acetyltransferase [Acidimicrobiia bacterium]
MSVASPAGEPPTIDDRAHDNLCAFTRFQARLDPGSELLDDGGVVAVAGSIDFPSTRSAVRSASSLPADAWVDTLTAFLDRHGKTGCVFARVGADDDLHERLTPRGFQEWAQTPEMVCEQPLEPRTPPEGITVRLAELPADVAAYAAVAGQAFTHLGVPEAATRTPVDTPDVLLGSDCVVAVAELDGVVVAGALAVLFGPEPDGYVGWVACADAARGRGLGDVVTRAVTNEAFARGAQLLTLEASPFGESTYARMGYRERYRYRVLIRL